MLNKNISERMFCIYIYDFILYNVLKKSNNIIGFGFYNVKCCANCHAHYINRQCISSSLIVMRVNK